MGWSAVVAVVILLLTVLFYLWRKVSQNGDTILLAGMTNSGKTSLFAKLINSENAWRTCPSTKENIYTEYYGKKSKRPYKLVDYPGDRSLKGYLLSNWLSSEKQGSIRGIVFVVDSSAGSKENKDSNELFYDILLAAQKHIPVLVACNKQDLRAPQKEIDALSVRRRVEEEFGHINKSRVAALESTSGRSEKPKLLAKTGDNFKLSDLGRRVEFVNCSAVDNGAHSFEPVRQWIDSL